METVTDANPVTAVTPHTPELADAAAGTTTAVVRTVKIHHDLEGLLFTDRITGNLRGGMRVSGQTFQTTGTRQMAPSGTVSWNILGRGDGGAELKGRLFQEAGGLTPEGRQRPKITGRIKPSGDRTEWRVAGWPRQSGANRFFSLKLTARPAWDGETLQLPFDEPVLG
jgi:hypothetical protein